MDEPNPAPYGPRDEAEFARRVLAEHERLSQVNGLTAAEIVAVRKLLETDRRWSWVFNGVKTWAVWIVAIIGAWTIGLDTLKSAIKALGK